MTEPSTNGPTAKFCIFDDCVRPGVSKLPDVNIVEMVLLYDHTDFSDHLPEMARLFAVDYDEVRQFFHQGAMTGGSLAELWVDGLNTPLGEEAALREFGSVLTSLIWRVAVADEAGNDLLTASKAYRDVVEKAVGTRDFESLGLQSPEELDEVWQTTLDAEEILRRWLNRREGEEDVT